MITFMVDYYQQFLTGERPLEEKEKRWSKNAGLHPGQSKNTDKKTSFFAPTRDAFRAVPFALQSPATRLRAAFHLGPIARGVGENGHTLGAICDRDTNPTPYRPGVGTADASPLIAYARLFLLTYAIKVTVSVLYWYDHL